jgi:hypothetical protein
MCCVSDLVGLPWFDDRVYEYGELLIVFCPESRANLPLRNHSSRKQKVER